MRIIPTILFSLLTAGLGFLVIMQQTRGNLDFIFGSKPLPVGSNVYQFDPSEVGRINILNSDGTSSEIVKAGGVWMIKEPWADFADARTVRSLIDFAARLQIEDFVDRDDIEDLAEVGLKKSKIEVKLFSKSGATLCHFNMGRYTSWRGFDPKFKSEDPTQAPPSFPTLFIQPLEEDRDEHLYVCSDFADPKLRVVLMRDLFANGLRLFRDHRLFYNSPGFAAEITLKEKNSEITVKRDGMSKEDDWKISKPYELATSPKALNNLLGGLAAIQAGAVVDPSDLALPAPLPENIDHTINIRYFLPDGSVSDPVSAIFYPPTDDKAVNVPVVVSTEPGKTRNAVLLVPRGPNSILASIPRDVNSLRSRTMTSLQVRQIEAVTLSDFTGREIALTLEKDPHERARRWFAKVSREDGSNRRSELYNGAANIYQVKELFEALFLDEVNRFTNDASTDPAEYGLDQPIRRISLKLRDGENVNFVIGEKLRPQYFARRAAGGRPLEISEDAYEAALEGNSHRELEIVSRPGNNLTSPPTGLELLGLEEPKIAKINGTTIHLGKVSSRRFYANRLDDNGNHTPHVVEIGPQNIGRMPLEAYHWQGIRLWNLNRYDIRSLIIERAGKPKLELAYDFFAPEQWSATRAGVDVTALLNTNKADKLMKKITDVEVKKWIGPIAEGAAERLATPGLKISILIKDLDDEGNFQGKIKRELRLAEVAEGQSNSLCFGKSDSSPSYFLVDSATFQRLSVDLLEE